MISLASPLNLHHPNTSPWLVCSVPSPHMSSAMAGGNQTDLGGGGGWDQGLERCIFLTGLGREVAEAEHFSGIAVALTVSPKQNRVRKEFRERCRMVGVPDGTVPCIQFC